MTMQPWFADAKLGIFIHWGIYAVDGIPESWAFFNGQVTYDDYMKQLDGFTASRFDADSWAALFRRSGAKYAVLTAKHHDGVALWDTAVSDLSVVKKTPAGRDLVAEYVTALRAHDLKVGFYFSHLDWSHPDYASVHPGDVDRVIDSPFAVPSPGQEDPAAWQRFLAFHRAQLRELATRFEPDLLWFDGQWERDPQQWQMADLRADLDTWLPATVFNGRLLGHGDYATPEIGLPIMPPEGPWELCLTINDSWGFQPHDTNHKSVGQLIRIFTEVIGAGGNLLLDVGPREDGTITSEQTDVLLGLGAWIDRHREAVYGTIAGLPYGHHDGPSTLSTDRRVIYLVCFDQPREFVAVRGLRNDVKRIRVLGFGDELGHRVVGGFDGEVPGVVYIDAPGRLDDLATVIAVELDSELSLYRGAGHG